MKPIQLSTDKGHILYDGDCLGQVADEFFAPDHWAGRGLLLGSAPGRGSTVFIRHEGMTLALRHYHRGGLPARLSRDRYLWHGLEQSRPWSEWHLLAELYRRGLPVPRPIAARVVRNGLTYRADIVTEVIEGARPLAEWLMERSLPAAQLERIGACLRRFHREGVFHADLNARNILLNDAGEVFLIDFDRGEMRREAEGWCRANLERLHRSLEKFRRNVRHFAFDDEDWKALLRGYENGVK